MTQNAAESALYKGKVKSSRLRRPGAWCPFAETEADSPATPMVWNKEAVPGQWKNNAIGYRHGAGTGAGAVVLYGDFHVMLLGKYQIPSSWAGGSPTYYGCFWNPWPQPGEESRWL